MILLKKFYELLINIKEACQTNFAPLMFVIVAFGCVIFSYFYHDGYSTIANSLETVNGDSVSFGRGLSIIILYPLEFIVLLGVAGQIAMPFAKFAFNCLEGNHTLGRNLLVALILSPAIILQAALSFMALSLTKVIFSMCAIVVDLIMSIVGLVLELPFDILGEMFG